LWLQIHAFVRVVFQEPLVPGVSGYFEIGIAGFDGTDLAVFQAFSLVKLQISRLLSQN
jgi:hypothetical protein